MADGKWWRGLWGYGMQRGEGLYIAGERKYTERGSGLYAISRNLAALLGHLSALFGKLWKVLRKLFGNVRKLY